MRDFWPMANKYAGRGADFDKLWPFWLQSAERQRRVRIYKMCARKRGFPSEKAAKSYLVGKGAKPLRSYQCPHCHRWHLTGQAPKVRPMKLTPRAEAPT